MNFDLAAIVAQAGRARRAGIAIAVIQPTRALQDDLARIYVKVPREVSTFCRDRLLPAYERTLSETRDSFTRDTVPEVQGQIEGLGAQLQRLILTLVPEMSDWVVRVEGWHRDRWVTNIASATSVKLSSLIGPADARVTLETTLARNVALIKDLSAQVQGRVADAVWRGLQQRQPAREVAKEMQKAVTMSRQRAVRIAADQVQKLSSDLDQERRRQAGIDEWIWRHSRKLHPRKFHQARDGIHYTDETAPADLPGQLPFCGCKAQAWVTF